MKILIVLTHDLFVLFIFSANRDFGIHRKKEV